MSRPVAIFLIGVVFGVIARVLRLIGVMPDEGPHVWAFAFGFGILAGFVGIFLLDFLTRHRRTLHPRH